MKAIVIVANGWNASWLGCYGNEWLSTPNLDRLAVESVVFDQHFTTSPSRSKWFQGISAPWFQSLRERGTKLITIRDRPCQDPPKTWDEIIEVAIAADEPPGEAMFKAIRETTPSIAREEHWLMWIETDRLLPPWSVSLDFFDEYGKNLPPNDDDTTPLPWDEPPHGPIELDAFQRERLQATFAAVVTEWDHDLGTWFAFFRDQGLADAATWIITSSHGVSLGEHQWVGPTADRLFEECTHVPLLIRLPLGVQGETRVPALTASSDLSVILSDLPANLLKPLPRVTLCQEACNGGGWAIRTEEWALLSDAPAAKIFRKPEDRWEVNDLRQQHLEWAEYLESFRLEVKQAEEKNEPPPTLRHYDDAKQEEE